MRSDFFDVPQTDYTTSCGMVQLPVFYQRLAMRTINYFIEDDRVLPILKGTGLLPARFFNGKVLTSLTFFNYQEVSLTAYDEFVLSVSVYPEALGRPSLPSLKLLLAKSEKRWKNMGVYVVEMVEDPDSDHTWITQSPENRGSDLHSSLFRKYCQE